MQTINLSEHELQSLHATASFLTANVHKRFTIPQLARMVNLSEKKLKTGFKNHFNKGVFQFQREHRFEKIKSMVLKNEPLKAIAAVTGYRDEKNLMKAFRNKFKTSPSQWRKAQRKLV